MGGPAHGLTQEEYEEKFGKRIAGLEERRRLLEKQVSDLQQDAIAGRHFKQLMRAVHENSLVKKEWERFMMTLRMTGYDKK